MKLKLYDRLIGGTQIRFVCVRNSRPNKELPFKLLYYLGLIRQQKVTYICEHFLPSQKNLLSKNHSIDEFVTSYLTRWPTVCGSELHS
jgi:hypothetical protein